MPKSTKVEISYIVKQGISKVSLNIESIFSGTENILSIYGMMKCKPMLCNWNNGQS